MNAMMRLQQPHLLVTHVQAVRCLLTLDTPSVKVCCLLSLQACLLKPVRW